MSMRNSIRVTAVPALISSVVMLLVFFTPKSYAVQAASSHFPNIELITQDGQKVHFYDDLIKGKIVAIDFIYTTCEYACPLETARMVQVQQKLGGRVGQDIFFYSISIDPENDTPAALKEYMKKFHVGPGWTFLTGKKADIDLLQKRLGVYSDPKVNADGHLPHLLIGNDALNQWVRSNALDNPSFQARMIGEFVDTFKHSQPAAAQTAANDGRPLENFDRGKYLFGRDCLACHTIGHGDKVGPDLLGVTRVRDRQWLVQMVQSPEKLLDGSDPIAAALLKKYNGVRMPHMWLSDGEVQLVIDFMERQTASHEQQEKTPSGDSASPAPGGGGQAAASNPK
jgi:protein SCO1